MIVTEGGLEGGFGLYLRDGKPTFVYNFLGADRPTFAAKDPLPKGKTKLVVNFAYAGGGLGKAGTVTMTANGNKIAEGRLERSVPVQFSLGEGLDIGMDGGSAVDFTYKLPFKFHGHHREGRDRTRPGKLRARKKNNHENKQTHPPERNVRGCLDGGRAFRQGTNTNHRHAGFTQRHDDH